MQTKISFDQFAFNLGNLAKQTRAASLPLHQAYVKATPEQQAVAAGVAKKAKGRTFLIPAYLADSLTPKRSALIQPPEPAPEATPAPEETPAPPPVPVVAPADQEG